MLVKKVTTFIQHAAIILALYCPVFASLDAVKEKFFQIPLYFEKNEGQVDSSIKYMAHYADGTIYFTSYDMVMVFANQTSSLPLKIAFVGAGAAGEVEGIDKQEGTCHYFIGNDPKKWLTNIPTYTKICYKEVYPGIDVFFYGNKGRLEYDICVAPGSDPNSIRLRVQGANNLLIDGIGNMQILTDDTQELVMLKPCIYQIIDDKRTVIEGKFILLAPQEIGFDVGDYDRGKPLVIDPLLDYSTYLGGTVQDISVGITVDQDGNVFVAGITNSPDFPVTPSAYQTTLVGPGNAFITKLNVAESKLVYSTYLGGGSPLRGDNATGLAIDNAGNAYIVGSTDSPTFPTTPGAFQTTLNGLSNCFITKLNSTGSDLIYSTYVGGSAVDRGDASGGIVVDKEGNAFFTGQTRSTDFPTTPGAYQETLAGDDGNCFVTKLNATGTGLIYSTYLGGSNPSANGDRGHDITIDDSGNAYVTGVAESSNFPTTLGSYQTFLAGIGNCFVTKFNPSGSDLMYSTLIGGSNFDSGYGITLDEDSNAYIAGTATSANFPVTPNAFQTALEGPVDCFITKLNPSGSALIYSTFLGGTSEDAAFSIVVDNQRNVCFVGLTSSSDFPVTADAFQATLSGEVNCFVTKLNAGGSALIYSTYVGGANVDLGVDCALDSNQNVHFTGFTSSPNFPVTPNAYQSTLAGNTNCFIAMIMFNLPAPSNFQGTKLKNIFLTQTDYINHLSWLPSSSLVVITGYKIFRDGVLIAQIPAGGPFFYNDHDRIKNKNYTYTLVAFNSTLESAPLTITL